MSTYFSIVFVALFSVYYASASFITIPLDLQRAIIYETALSHETLNAQLQQLSSLARINKAFAKDVVSDDVVKKFLERHAIHNKQLIAFIKKNKPVSICARVCSVINNHKLLDQQEVDTLLLQGASERLINTVKQSLALNANVNVRSKFRQVKHQGKSLIVSLEPLDEKGFVEYQDFLKSVKMFYLPIVSLVRD